ncbi:DUF1839 family protein [Piscinibacter gummiphilus]|uniref:Uncharacterized protein n=1 Tax=Piscinibacter gummiphilus TaxID=946333 RepID=A0A1W6LD73_9BURK|nr:DUF1839 family protein [Piscinibacter gummiphilus]ARN22173.1 hypothetical protein A4W93_20970 [Piscinibacter gummiphilus]ATU66861.1 DUF1839 domain-containing protein [Piscinibacter gummiphilus]GLS94266.1 hypothetical protein GCM10007918_15580 [Piscinibacter gummiphilus]
MKRILDLDAATYRRHAIHGEDRVWAETNCYTDLLVEQLHALGVEPVAALPFTLGIDFEGDQWTFFKFPDGDLADLYGIEVQELAVWRPLTDHIEDQVELGRPVMVELDSFFLPDTAGTAYGLAHMKSTVGVNEIDVSARHLGYFHNQGYYTLGGDDFDALFQMNGLVHERMLPPYIEYLKRIPGQAPLQGGALLEASLGLLRRQLSRLPADNPFGRFKAQFSRDIAWLMDADMEIFHTYSFANLRQYGACFELAETYLRWLAGQGVPNVTMPAEKFAGIAQTAKAFQFQLARSMARKKPLDLAPLDAMAAAWDEATGALRTGHG